MSISPTPSPANEKQLNEALAAYLEEAEAGCEPDRAAFLAAHPDLASELEIFFTDRDRFARAAASLGAAPAGPHTPTLGPAVMTRDAALGTVRCFGDYELLEEIARGGMGVVFKARQLSLNRIIALKMILAGQLASEAEVRRFNAEAGAAARLDHPNIVQVYEVGEHEGLHYFSMKLIEGPSLQTDLKRFAGDPRGAARVVACVARAVHHAHQRGILHRDLKPSNILLDDQGQPHVTDFGLARKIEAEGGPTQSGAVVGTPEYMAPEQATAQKTLTTATDVHGLGSLLYALLTGRPPFRGDTALETLGQVVAADPAPPHTLNPCVDRDLETICLKCLQKEPHRRYGSVEALVEDIERWLHGEPVRARPVGKVERALKWMRRRPALAALLVVSALAVLAQFGAGLWYVLSLREERDVARRQQEAAEEARKRTAALAIDESAARSREEQQRLRAEAQFDQARRLLFTAQVLRAAAVRERDPAEAVRLLDDTRACPLDLRDFAWGFTRRVARRDSLTLWGHTPDVLSVAFTADGKFLASGDEAGTIKLWEVASGKELVSFEAHRSRVWSLAFSLDGKTLASAGDDWKLRLWEVPSRRLRADLEGHTRPVTAVAVSRSA